MRRALVGLGLLAVLLAAPAVAEEPVVRLYPSVSAEASLWMFSALRPRQAEGRARGTEIALRGEILGGLHLTEQFSVQASLHLEPIQAAEPNGGTIGLRAFGGFVDSLYALWQAHDTLRIELGKFTAPFGYGYHYFPGILPRWRAHEVYWIREAVGVGGSWTFLSHPAYGEHDLSAALFTQDRSPLSTTFVTRRRCCEAEAERYMRNSVAVGGPGNTGRLNNFSAALDGDRFSWLPNFSYHAAVLSRGQGRDGTAREWGYALGARYEHRWPGNLRTLFFTEQVAFRNAGGRPNVTDEDGTVTPIAERRRFTTIGARTTYQEWRAALVWQQDQRKRSPDSLPTAWYAEASIGRALGGGFGADVGYQYSRIGRETAPGRLSSHAILAMLTWHGSR